MHRDVCRREKHKGNDKVAKDAVVKASASPNEDAFMDIRSRGRRENHDCVPNALSANFGNEKQREAKAPLKQLTKPFFPHAPNDSRLALPFGFSDRR
jgi:hypothetical protein